MTKLILATSSPFRLKAFDYLDLEFIAQSSNVDERFEGRPTDPKKLVKCLAKLKAEHIAKEYSEGIVIGFDSVGCHKKHILEKPKSRQVAYYRLKALSGNKLNFYTGVHMINCEKGTVLSDVASTTIFMREITDLEINKYLDQDPKFDTSALGFNPLKFYSATFAKKITGSYNNFTRGMPLELISEMLPKIGYKVK
jgi:septum formation protein